MRRQRLPQAPLQDLVLNHIAQLWQLELCGVKGDMRALPLPGLQTTVCVDAHRPHGIPDVKAFQQADRGRADCRDPHIRGGCRIESRRRRFLKHRHGKSLLRQPQRQGAADHAAAHDGDICCVNCHGYYP